MSTLLAKGLKFKTPLFKSPMPVALLADHYIASGALALILVSDDSIGEPIAKLSLHVDEVSESLAFNEFIVKDYSENEGVEEWLISSGIASDTGDFASFGFLSGSILKLTEKYSDILKGTLS